MATTQSTSELQQALNAAREQLVADQALLGSARNSLDAWKAAGNSDLANKLERIQWWSLEVERLVNLVSMRQQTVSELEARLDQAVRAEELYNEGLAQAASKGLVGEQAEEYARSMTEAAKMRKWVTIAAISAAALIALMWAWVKFIKK